jgi:uncharacterized membrane protein YcaP (DUF421 family)
VLEENRRRKRMTRDELARQARLNQIGSLDTVAWAIPANSGQVSFIKKSGN